MTRPMPGCGPDCEPFAHYGCPTAEAEDQTVAAGRWVASRSIVHGPPPDGLTLADLKEIQEAEKES
jgi:hypothetical protein